MSFGDSGTLRKHKMRHDGTLPLDFICEICQKAFNQQWGLDCHMRSHTGEKPFVCEFCQRPFSELGNLKKHKEKKHKDPMREPVPPVPWEIGMMIGHPPGNGNLSI